MTSGKPLPKGYTSQEDTWGSWNSVSAGPYVKEDQRVCTCGVEIAMGKDYPIEKHSDWCELRKKKL